MDKQFLNSLGKVCAVIGAQWGDEGKGKVTDILAEHFDVIARGCGGANAGHTVVVGGKKHVFHLLPAGSLHAGKPVVLGSGMVIHLPTLLEEIRTLEEGGIEIADRLYISPAAHIVFEYHKDIDGVLEERRMKSKGEGIGTTRRGIGPAYMDKAMRSGIRMETLSRSSAEWKTELNDRNESVKDMFGVTVNVDTECEQLENAKKILSKQIVHHISETVSGFIYKGKTVLIEGAQAVLLDIDHGTYPYVTSSSTTVAGALQGLGIAPKHLSSTIGVAKAYCTRVGTGAFPTEENGETGDRLRKRGGEFGATTGRPRRCGWLHLPDIEFAAAVNGFDCWNITKLDVLDEEDEIPVGIGISTDGSVEYEYVKGWKSSTAGITSFAGLPAQAQALLKLIEDKTGVPVRLIGTGQGREEMIVVSK